ncbi:MAG: hypothetical protein HS119_04925 [Flavobacteriales bacterium]|nr:hypothetical protein [Flavobacteriales bacterium]
MSINQAIHNKILAQNKTILTASSILLAVLIFFTNYNIYSCLGLSISAYIMLRFVLMLGYTIPVIELMLFLAAAQWIIGPFIDYHSKVSHYKMHMYVPELEYMEITVPAYFVFVIASLNLFRFNPIDIEYFKDYISKNIKLSTIFIVLGIVFNLIQPFAPVSISFVVYLGSNLALVGMGLFFLSKASWTNKLLLTAIGISPVIVNSIRTGTFHTSIIWGIFIFIFITLNIKLSFFRKALIIATSFLFLTTLQLIKQDYREQINSKSFQGNKFELFVDLLLNPQNTEELQSDDELNNVNSRLNQGWIISKIYERIPEKKDYLKGETIIGAFEALVPRFLYPNKKVSGGGKKTFELLTGIFLLENTAMGTSLMGEFYGNYGFYGALISFLIWGILLKLLVSFIIKRQQIYPILTFCLPIIFFQVIKAESDLSTVLNHLVKSLAFILVMIFFIKKLFVKET